MKTENARKAKCLGLFLFIVGMVVPASSYDYIVEKLESLVRRASAVVVAEVTKIELSRDEHNVPIRLVNLKVLEKVAGESVEPFITLRLPTLGYGSVNRPLVPSFNTGEKSVLILKKITGGSWMVLGHNQGKYEMTNATIEGTEIPVEQFKRQIVDVFFGRANHIDVPPRRRATRDSAGDYGGEGISKLGGEFHLLDPTRYGPTSGTIEFHINPANAKDPSGNSLSFNDIKAAIQRAVDSWNNVNHSNVTFSIASSSTNSSRSYGDAVSTITFESNASLYGSNGATWTHYSNGIIDEVDMAFNTSDRWNTDVNYPSSYETYNHPTWGTIGPVDLEDVAAHELGHGVGLHHVGDTYDTYTMYATDYAASTWWTKTWRRSLERGDNSGKVYQEPSSTTSLSGSLPFSLLYGAPPSVDVSVSVSGNVTVPSGYRIEFENGDKGTFSFNGDFKLRVEGTMMVGGGSSAVSTFTRSGGQWYGIEFDYGASGSSLSYCTIENAHYGLFLTGTSPYVSNCTIRNNSTGVHASGTYSTFLWTILDNNDSCGFNLTAYSDPTISHSVLRYNNYAIYGDATSVPTMGGISGSNSFDYTGYYDVYTSYSGTINAQSNWWYPWSPNFYGNVDYSNYLGSDPNTWAQRLASSPNRPPLPPNLAKVGGLTKDTLGMKEIDQAYQLLLNGSQEQALGAFQSIAGRYPDAFAGGRALAFADHILEKSGRDAKQNLAAMIAQHPNSKAAMVGKSLLTGHLVKEGNYKDALENAVSLIESPDKMIAKQALSDAGNIEWYRVGDKAKGTEFFRTLIANYPQDPLSISAQATLGEWTGRATPNQPKANQAQNNNEKSAFLQNYPNPFNPLTVIRFALPMDGLVSLKVFDVLGREVAVLVNEFKVAGIHQALFDASSLPSGVYIYRLETPWKSLVQKMTVLR